MLTDDSPQSRSTGVTELGGTVLYDRKKDPLQLKPIVRGQGSDDVMDAMHQALRKHLREVNDPFVEKVWMGRSDQREAPDKNRRYDDLVSRHYLRFK